MKLQSKKASSFWLFMLGLGSATKIFFLGTIAFSELAIFPLAPLILAQNWHRMKREGFLPFIYMLTFMSVGLFVSGFGITLRSRL